MKATEAEIIKRQAAIVDAARTLIGMVRVAERTERQRTSQKTELELNVELTAGGNETWVITIERTASSH